MSDNKKYYYMRLKDNYFESDNMILLESMPDGYLYSNILLKLYLRSLKDDGRLMLNGRIPYNPQMLATVVRHQVGTVEKALNIFRDLGLIEVLDNGAIYMLDIQNYIGQSSTEPDRKRSYRDKIASEKKMLQSGEEWDKCTDKRTDKRTDKNPPKLELEKEIDIEIEREIETSTLTFSEEQLSTGQRIKNIISQHWKRDASADDITRALGKVLTDGAEDFNKLQMFAIAMELSAAHGDRAKNWNYIDAIYKGWEERGIDCAEEWMAFEKTRFKDKKKKG